VRTLAIAVVATFTTIVAAALIAVMFSLLTVVVAENQKEKAKEKAQQSYYSNCRKRFQVGVFTEGCITAVTP
jgi:hypothetical protein